jgi:leader peptidase (prepilin peptidase)/N-methyltransferase
MSLSATAFVLSFAGAACGAVTGSFLNVAIHRLPRLIDAADAADRHISVSGYICALSWPPSHCAACGHRLLWRDNIPILSYIALRGRCRACHEPYGIRYLAVEVLAALAFGYCAIAFGLTAEALLSGLFLAVLVALSIIDFEEQLLPDALLAPLFLLGLLFHGFYGGGLLSALMGAAAGFGVLWLIRASYRLYAGVEGMGYGDVKLAGALGAWLGVTAVPAVLGLGFAAGVAVMLPFALIGKAGRRIAIPFGPFLAFAGACVFLIPGLAGAALRLFAPV